MLQILVTPKRDKTETSSYSYDSNVINVYYNNLHDKIDCY